MIPFVQTVRTMRKMTVIVAIVFARGCLSMMTHDLSVAYPEMLLAMHVKHAIDIVNQGQPTMFLITHASRPLLCMLVELLLTHIEQKVQHRSKTSSSASYTNNFMAETCKTQVISHVIKPIQISGKTSGCDMQDATKQSKAGQSMTEQR